MEIGIQEQLDRLFELVEDSDGILLSVVKDKQSHTYKSDFTFVYPEDGYLCFDITLEEVILLKYKNDEIKKIDFNLESKFKNISIYLKENDILVIHIF